jgi:hypothetical protein
MTILAEELGDACHVHNPVPVFKRRQGVPVENLGTSLHSTFHVL